MFFIPRKGIIKHGLGAFRYYGVPVLLSAFLMILGSKAIRRVGYLTQVKMMKARYSRPVSKILSIMILVFMTFTAASQMVGTGIVLIYSMFGGFRGVVRTDIIQFVLLVISVVTVFVVAMYHSGGFQNIAGVAKSAGKSDFMSFTAGAPKYMMYVITFGCAWMIQANVWQRISASKNDVDARRMTVMSFFAYIPLYLIVVFTGMAGIVLYETLPEGGIVIAIVTEYMSPLLGAIVFVGISAAIMSTMDSLINTGAMTLAMDLRTKPTNDINRLRFSRGATLLVTVVAIFISIQIRSILGISWIASDVITTGAFVPLIMGFFWRRGNSKGALSSMILGLGYCTYNLVIGFGIPLPAVWDPQSALQVITGAGFSFVVFVAVSISTKPEYEKADKFIAMAGQLQRSKNGLEKIDNLSN